ncbi:glycerate kinase [Amycolatopsis deserti]|uniref:Glycerate kinase n=1 Tax=Amycolatopsis deserti TaxID=185696 RepID=A0ABQ3ID21_9PSEU|nr:glycerate kinase [Amycolatopsis deserti]GHE76282.1 glycerate kinase [Amycolatopsis deserti]
MGEVVVALDSFKGSLGAAQATAALARGLRRHAARPLVHEHPVADGGEGTVDAAVAAGFTPVGLTVTGPLGRPVAARYAHRGGVAVVELAQASGLPAAPDPTTALAASTFGTGELIAAALDAGHRQVVVGLGGSATTDGGTGLLAALGARLLDAAGRELTGRTSALPAVAAVDLTGLHRGLRNAELVVACDVDNALLGPDGAAAVFGPQKGADEATVATLERALSAWAPVLEAATGTAAAFAPGAGAAGGAGFALFTLGARRVPGIELVLRLTGLPARLLRTDLVITGEGSLDRQSLRGKAPLGVATAARQAGVPAYVVAGRSRLTPAEVTAAGFAGAFTLTDLEPDPGRCMTEAVPLLERLGERIARHVFG